MSQDLDQWHQRGRRYLHHGHSVFYQDQACGDGPTLLCIHGFPTASWDWHRIWGGLREHFGRIIAPDMIGFGFSDKPRNYPYAMPDQADLPVGLLLALGARDIHLLAHDIGDTVTQELLARLQRADAAMPRLRSVTLLNGGLFPETHRATRSQKLLLSPMGKLVSRAMGRRSFGNSFSSVFGPDTQPGPAELDDFWRLIRHQNGQRNMYRLIRYIHERRQHRQRWVEALQHSKVPMLLIDGLNDPVSGAHMVERFRKLVPMAQVAELPGIGHYPQLEAPQAVLDAFLRFAAAHDAPAA